MEILTKDGEVGSIDQIQIKREVTVTTKDEVLTLAFINTQVAIKQTQIQNLQKELDELLSLQAEMNILAATVSLKVEPELVKVDTEPVMEVKPELISGIKEG